MPIKRQYSINKMNYELAGQKSFFGRDNLDFKTVNFAKPQKLRNLCQKFKLKKVIIKSPSILLNIYSISL